MTEKNRRSWLIVPASKATGVDQVAGAAADVVVLDLVEFVAGRDRAAARQRLRSAVEKVGSAGAEVFVQIDPTVAEVDLDACVWPGVSGVVVSRAEAAQQIAGVATRLDRLEQERGIPSGTVRIVPALETAQGNHAAHPIVSASPRVWGVTLGRADLVMDLRPEPSGEIHLMPYLMQRLIIVAGAAGVTPLGAWWRAPDRGLLATADNTYDAGRRGRAIGFKGAMCVRADQVGPLNRAFTPVTAGAFHG